MKPVFCVQGAYHITFCADTPLRDEVTCNETPSPRATHPLNTHKRLMCNGVYSSKSDLRTSLHSTWESHYVVIVTSRRGEEDRSVMGCTRVNLIY